jgi:hypothetical protein
MPVQSDTSAQRTRCQSTPKRVQFGFPDRTTEPCDRITHDGHCSGRIRYVNARLVYTIVCDECGLEIRRLRSEPYDVNARPGPAVSPVEPAQAA